MVGLPFQQMGLALRPPWSIWSSQLGMWVSRRGCGKGWTLQKSTWPHGTLTRATWPGAGRFMWHAHSLGLLRQWDGRDEHDKSTASARTEASNGSNAKDKDFHCQEAPWKIWNCVRCVRWVWFESPTSESTSMLLPRSCDNRLSVEFQDRRRMCDIFCPGVRHTLF